MSVPGYESYRDSGVEWLGDMPAHWRTAPFWALFRRTKRIGHPEAELLSVYRDYGVIRKSDRDDNFNNPSEDLGTYQLVEPGDLAINKMKAWQGSLGVSQLRGIVSPAYFVYQAEHAEAAPYLHYLLRSPPLAAAFMTLSKGIRINQWDIDPDQLRLLPIPLPPRDEQVAIAAFLDRETGKIDALVAAQRRLIELLKEKRQAVISHAVTKGLDPAAPMKDSGVEWLGEVPAHWEVRKLLTVLRSAPCYGVLVPDNDPDGVPMMRIMDMNGGRADPSDFSTISPALSQQYSRTILSVDDLALSVVGTIGTSLIADESLAGVNLSRAIARLQFNEDCSPQFARWLFESDAFRTFVDLVCVGSAQRVLNMDDLRAVRFPFPPPQEQAAICDYLSVTVAGLEALADQAAAAAALLEERRSALISAAVTGKIDVRGMEQPRKGKEAA